MTGSPHVLLIDDAPRLAARIRDELTGRGIFSDTRQLSEALSSEAIKSADLALMVLDQHATLEHVHNVIDMLDKLVGADTPTLVWGMPEQAGTPHGPMLDNVPASASMDEVLARLFTMERYAPLVRRLEREVDNLQRLGDQLNRYFSEIDQELRLAGRLQHDFLPAKLPQTPPLSFSTIYRPASWVSGDMYDIFRIDERHVGMFLCDAMGHGIAAGLLTMFLRQALVVKKVVGTKYEIVAPADAMSHLNDCLVCQQLPNCQFVTAIYAIIDTETLEMRVARGGHPNAIHIRANGEVRDLPTPGGLLGIPDLPDDFGEIRTQLEPGDKVVLYTDGIEEAFVDDIESTIGKAVFTNQLQEWAKLDIHQFVRQVNFHLDSSEGSLHPSDDVTVLGMQITA